MECEYKTTSAKKLNVKIKISVPMNIDYLIGNCLMCVLNAIDPVKCYEGFYPLPVYLGKC